MYCTTFDLLRLMNKICDTLTVGLNLNIQINLRAYTTENHSITFQFMKEDNKN